MTYQVDALSTIISTCGEVMGTHVLVHSAQLPMSWAALGKSYTRVDKSYMAVDKSYVVLRKRCLTSIWENVSPTKEMVKFGVAITKHYLGDNNS